MTDGQAGARGSMPTALLTVLALTAFAANSLLCRLALREESIDAASFTSIRLFAGAGALLAVLLARREKPSGSFGSALALFLYALPFALAYRRLEAGTGALVLFGAVQATMIASGLRRGERLRPAEIAGLTAALAGLAILGLPGLSAPSPEGLLLMGLAGVAWGIYSLRGKAGGRPVAATAGNFLLAAPLALLGNAVFASARHFTPRGVLLAALSGALTSGLGYVIWYAALKGLTASRAAIVQLAVPALAAIGGILLLGETLTTRLLGSAILILGGVALAVKSRQAPAPEAGTGTP
jgi:drug/metabolite transporter (DMT)-like permease